MPIVRKKGPKAQGLYRLLIVEGNPDLLELVTEQLSNYYSVTACSNGQMAIDYLQENGTVDNFETAKSGSWTAPALGDLDGAEVPLLLHVEQGDGVRVAEEEHAGAGVEDLVAVRGLDLLRHLVLQVFDDQLQRMGYVLVV